MIRRVVLATGNAHKLREIDQLLRELLPDAGLTLVAQSELGVTAAEETGASFVENALLKARHAAGHSGLAALADDSGIAVDALGGRPGIHSARYAGTGAGDAANRRRLLDELEPVAEAARTARYHCAMVYVRYAEDPIPLIGEGAWLGRVARTARGSGGFGYDPIFLPDDTPGCTAAELTAQRKHSLSHRGKALRALCARLAADGVWSR